MANIEGRHPEQLTAVAEKVFQPLMLCTTAECEAKFVYICSSGCSTALQQYQSSVDYMENITWIPGVGIAVGCNSTSAHEITGTQSEVVVTKLHKLPQVQVTVVNNVEAYSNGTNKCSISNQSGNDVIDCNIYTIKLL